jgi:branched-chain amino acid transport system permease protein
VGDVIPTIVSGLTIGSLYAAMAVGLTIIYGVSHVFNFAHGHVAVLGAYLAWFIIGTGLGFGAGLLLGSLASLAVLAIGGWVMYRLAVRRLLQRDGWQFSTLLFTLGLAILLQYVLLEVFGPRVKSIAGFTDATVRFSFGRVGVHEIIIFVLSLLLLGAVGLFLQFTTIGRAMRAVSSSAPGARIVGINVDRIYGQTFALAFAVTALSGIMLASTVYLTPHIGWEWMIKGFIIVVFGGLGKVQGAVLAALVLGLVEVFVTLYAGTLWVWPAWLGLFVVALLLRPQGILGGKPA